MTDINTLIPSVGFLRPGEMGQWAVLKEEITQSDLNSWDLSAVKDPYRIRQRRPKLGPYTRLEYRGNIFPDTVMSDTEGEKWAHENFVSIATGTVLINGLGLGVALNAVLLKPDVRCVYVIEKSPEVCALVGRQYQDRVSAGLYGEKGFVLINEDAFTFQPLKGEQFNVVWHDIWTDIVSDSLPGIARLKRKYAKRLVLPGKWQGAWMEHELRATERIARRVGL